MERKTSRIPGEFEAEEDNEYNDDPSDYLSSLLHASTESSDIHPSQEEKSEVAAPTDTVLEERAIHNELLDEESSFLPEFSHLAAKDAHGPTVDDTYMFGVPNDNIAVRKRLPTQIEQSESPFRDIKSESSDAGLRSPQTPPGAYKTPAPEQQNMRLFEGDNQENQENQEKRTPEIPNTSSLETMSSSPTAAAAARTVSRAQSMATMGGYETADERGFADSPTKELDDVDATPTKTGKQTSRNGSPSRSRLVNMASNESFSDRISKRPKYLNSRSSHQRLSYSSMASSNTDASDATLGADFALQSGGALPDVPRLQRKPKMTLSRSTSLGSIVSGISGISDDEAKTKRAPGGPDLSTLEEEHTLSSPGTQRLSPGPITPRASSSKLAMPTDTVIANNARDFEVPGTFARQYRQQQGSQSHLPLGPSPDKNHLTIPGMTPAPSTKKGMTLKEHRSTVDRLGKENFDLKMKVHFLDEALQKRSEDGVKEMITENVKLKSDRMRLEKDNHSLRKQVRELQRKLDGVARESPNADQGYATDEERSPTAEEEVVYLRERVEMNEVEIEKLRSKSVGQESDKRRLAEMVQSLRDTRGGVSDVGSREERDMWKDMLEAETIAREQSEEECKKLREEMAKLRSESFGQGRSLSRLKGQQSRLGPGSVVSRTSSTDGRGVSGVNGVQAADNVELERLRHECSELQKIIGAQSSTLTSRNKEKERLYQEIEDLKLGRMGAVRSIAGDSIFERSASRARSNSRASNGTRFSRVSETERDSLETKINELRDQVSQLRLENQNLKSQCDEMLAEFDALEAQAQVDVDQFNEELRLLTQERDDALRDAEGQDEAFQQLKLEAQTEIDGLGDELDEKIEELRQRDEDVNAMQADMRLASEGLIRLEEDAQSNLQRYEEVRRELDEERREVEKLQREVRESEGKIQRLSVQQESGLNEIAFLREEQDADKIKIGDLEGLVKRVHLNLDSEREKCRDLDRRLNEERQQRDAMTSQREQDVARVIDGLNREVSGLREEARRARKQLQTREMEASGWKERHGELEGSLREVLGFGSGGQQSGQDPSQGQGMTRSGLISGVTRMQRELDQTAVDLDATRRRLDEKETLLSSRDALLESSGLEYRKIADALERERQARRQDKHSFEQSLKSHQQSARALSVNHSRIAELEQARQSDRKKLSQLETQYKEQLAERNAILLSIWKKLSAMCGPDWAHNNSLINGNLPSQEVIGNMLFWPGFSRNLLLATKQVEGTLSQFREKIKRVERELWKEYQGLEAQLELRARKLERVEEAWEKMKNVHAEQQGERTPRGSSRHSNAKTPEMQKLKGENRLLKAELGLLQQQQHAHPSHYRAHERGVSRSSASTYTNDAVSLTGTAGAAGIPQRKSSMRGGGRGSDGGSIGPAGTLTRSHTTNVVEHIGRSNSITSTDRDRNVRSGELMVPVGPLNAPANGNFAIPPPSSPTQLQSQTVRRGPGSNHSGHSGSEVSLVQGQDSKWIHRLMELEKRLKAERQARLLDRSGARRRLEERDAVNEELRLELERERMRREVGITRAGMGEE